MPGPAVHYIVGKKLTQNYPFQVDYRNNRDANDFLFDQSVIGQLKEFQPYLNFGTVGPDFLFFNLKDWPAGEFIPVRAMIRFMEYMKSLEAKVEESFPILNQIKTFKDQLEEVADEFVENSPLLSSIRLLLDDIKAIIELMGEIVKSGIEDLVTSNIDIYSFLTSPIQSCEEKNNWWWFDVLHYRRTGKFAQYLLENSIDNPALHAYSIGYLSHVAADAVGHPYVNNIVRGPYRTHGQRHNVVEKIQDVSAFNLFESDEFGTSELHERFKFTESVHDLFSGERIEEVESIIDGLTPDIADVGLPKELAKLFSEATTEVFKSNGSHLFGGGMSEEDVDAAYRIWYSWFKSSTSEAILPDSLPDLPPLSEEIREVWEKFVEKFNDAIDELSDALNDLFSGGGSSFSWNSIVNFFKKIARVIKAAVAAAAALIQAIEETIVSIPKHALHFMLNQLYQALYSIYDYFRLSVSLNGLAFPAVRHLQDRRVQHMINPVISDVRGNRLANNWIYPIKKLDVNDGLFRTAPQEAHLAYPSLLNPESERSTVAPFSYSLNLHDYYIYNDINMDISFIEDIRPIEDFDRHHQLSRNEMMGNACELTGALYHLFKNDNNIPDINLDGDRGIGYPCWEAENCVDGNIEEPVKPKFTD